MTEPSPTTLSAETEAQVIAAARHDRAAFAPLYRAYVRSIYRYLYSRVGNATDAEDLTSQVFMEAIESLPRYRHRGYFLAWLFSIARHRLLNFQVRRRLEVSLDQAEAQPGPEADPLTGLVQDEQIRRLTHLIDGLRPEEQDLLRLRFAAGLSFAELAALLERSEDAVKKQVYRLLARLESQLEAIHD